MKGTTPKAEIDPDSPVPLHEQVAAAVRRAIADGEAKPGERLPPARDMAKVLGVNSNTVFRSLHTLRDEGLLEFSRGHGVSVTGVAPQRSAVVTKAREVVKLARRLRVPAGRIDADHRAGVVGDPVTLLDERLAPSGGMEADALIKEARRRQRRRRWCLSLVILAVVGGVGLAISHGPLVTKPPDRTKAGSAHHGRATRNRTISSQATSDWRPPTQLNNASCDGTACVAVGASSADIFPVGPLCTALTPGRAGRSPSCRVGLPRCTASSAPRHGTASRWVIVPFDDQGYHPTLWW